MASNASAPRRVRVERNIYQRANGVFEVGFKDAAGKQRWRTIDGGITAARAARDQLLTQRHRGELTPSRPKLRFRDAAQAWLDGPVSDLRPRTDECYRNAVDSHLMPRFGGARLDAIAPDDLAALVRELRADGLSESTGAIVVGVINRIYRFAARRLAWGGSYTRKLWMGVKRKAAYLPGC